MKLETIIGLEIHVQLKTKTKMFCGCSNDGENQPPNTTICEVCLGHPGVLPVPNQRAVELAVKTALALNCQINVRQNFDRKNYFYPDLPKGYQISQLAAPIGEHGELKLKALSSKLKTKKKNSEFKIRITRLHLEEDAAKNFHKGNKIQVDYNRGSTPLIEIVTEPDFKSPAQAKDFLQELRLIMRYLKVSDADMEKGHLRCDANISIRPAGDDKLYPKTEIKNLNSFKAVERALEYEQLRQTKLWEAGTPPAQQSTRGWDEQKQITREQRTKETSKDYRYFPEPDIPPLRIMENDKSQELNDKQYPDERSQNANIATSLISIQKITTELPELPAAKRKRFQHEYKITPELAKTLTADEELADYFEKTISELKAWLESQTDGSSEEIWDEHGKRLSKLVSNWLLNKLNQLIYENKLSWSNIRLTPENFAEFISLIHANKISATAAQKILGRMLKTGEDPSHIVKDEALEQVSDTKELAGVIDKVITKNPDEVSRYQAGKTALILFFVGQVMRQTKGRGNPALIQQLLEKKLSQ